MLFAQYMCCSPSMEVQIEETETDGDQEKDRAQHLALGNSRCDWDGVQFPALNNDLLSTVIKEGLDPAQSCTSRTI